MNKDAEIIGVWGSRGSGKTTRQIELTKNHNRIIVLDPIGSFKAPGFRTVRTLQEVYKAIKAGWTKGFRVILRTPSSEADCLATMRELAHALFIIQAPYKSGRDKRKIMLVIDEAQKFFPNRRMSPAEQEPLENIIALGRHYGIEMISASQRVAKVWTEYRGNCSQHYFFMQGDHTDLGAVVAIIGNQHKDTMRALKPHEFLHKGQGLSVQKGRNVAKFR